MARASQREGFLERQLRIFQQPAALRLDREVERLLVVRACELGVGRCKFGIGGDGLPELADRDLVVLPVFAAGVDLAAQIVVERRRVDALTGAPLASDTIRSPRRR